ncbi:MAG: hypothetical protein R2882_08655 [Gemmatimonadales bacterium]
MHRPRLTRAVLLLAALAACSSPDGAVTGPAPGANPPIIDNPAPSPRGERDRHERLAAGMARALRDPAFRASVYRALAESPFPEGKVELRSFLDRDGGAERRQFVRLADASGTTIANDVDRGRAIEVYFPVPEHRSRWHGGTDVIVATALGDGERPVAFDLAGRRSSLSGEIAPETPVLMVSPAETDFARRPALLECLVDCGSDTGGGGTTGTGSSTTVHGLFLTATRFTEKFEPWYKGSPEFEVHVLGQTGSSNEMTTYQCAGEHAGGPYTFDQNDLTWQGSVMLLSQAQIDQYNQQHPGQNFRIMVVEDDDTPCEIKADENRIAALLNSAKLVYGDYTGGNKGTDGAGVSTWKKVTNFLNLLRTAHSFLISNDDVLGNAIGDPDAARSFFTGANWIVRAEQNLNGALRLEIR